MGTVVKDGEKSARVQSQIPKYQSRGLKNSHGIGVVIMSEFVSNGYPGWGGVAMCPCCTLCFCLLAQKCLSPLWNKYFDGIMELEEALGSPNTVDFKLCSYSSWAGVLKLSRVKAGPPSLCPDRAALCIRGFQAEVHSKYP